jgi:hypothetical protein
VEFFPHSDKPGKRSANRVLRKRVKEAVGQREEPPALREVSNTYKFPSDGKAGQWPTKKWLAEHPKYLRK